MPALYGKVQHKLFAVVAAGRSAVSKKSEYIDKHGIPVADQFNAVRVSLEGKVSASCGSLSFCSLDSLRRRGDAVRESKLIRLKKNANGGRCTGSGGGWLT